MEAGWNESISSVDPLRSWRFTWCTTSVAENGKSINRWANENATDSWTCRRGFAFTAVFQLLNSPFHLEIWIAESTLAWSWCRCLSIFNQHGFGLRHCYLLCCSLRCRWSEFMKKMWVHSHFFPWKEWWDVEISTVVLLTLRHGTSDMGHLLTWDLIPYLGAYFTFYFITHQTVH